MTGQLLGHYRVLEQIGSGGMGEVYRARDERLGRDVALKLIRPSSAKDQDRVRRFEQEARAAAALSHPNIVAIYDIGVHDGMPFIVSELLEGKTLRERLANGSLSVREAADYGLQIAQGLMAAHDKHIVHRDLKPENLFITKDNRIKILDFGIAKLLHPEAEKSGPIQALTTQTRAGSILGTVAYMSPEQLRGKPIDARSDIFSLGAIIYEMLTGRRAFRGETDVDTITAVLRETPPELTQERANVPKSFEQIVNHCLEKEPENRFQSVRDLIFALETLATGSPPQVGSWFTAASLKKVMVAVAVLALLGASVWLLRPWFSAATTHAQFHRLTFERGTVYGARFTGDGRSVVYEASWHGDSPRLYSTLSASPQAQMLDATDAHLLAVSRSNQMALQMHGLHGTLLDYTGGTLAAAPLAGGAPRELMEDVRWADWDPQSPDKMAVIHQANGRSRLEFPVGTVLYENAGSISNVRFSPSGDKIAFMDHPVLWDDRGFVRMVDRSGKVTTLSTEWESESGLAWNTKGDEVWFTATEAGYNRRLMAVDLRGRTRLILSGTDGLNLQDIAADGRVLLTSEDQRVALEALVPPDKTARDLSWYDWSVAKDISRDGQWVLFEESGEPFGGQYAVSVRRLTGPPTHLGNGSAGGLSPDSKWALDVSTTDPPRVTLLPLGPGVPREVPLPGLEHVQNGSARFLPNGEQIIINGNEPGRPVRGFLVGLAGGKPRPVTPEGIAALLVSPDGRFVVAQRTGAGLVVCSVDNGSITEIPGMEVTDSPAQWSADSRALYVYHFGEMPARIYRLDLATGKRTVVRELQTAEQAGVVSIGPITMSPDATRFAYSYYQNLSALYVVTGLQ